LLGLERLRVLEEGVHRLGAPTGVARHRIAGVGRLCPPKDLREKVIAVATARARVAFAAATAAPCRDSSPTSACCAAAGCARSTSIARHGFHRAVVHGTPVQPAWRSIGSPAEGFVHGSVHASYLHLHWPGSPPSPPAWRRGLRPDPS